MALHGYAGRIARVDLTRKSVVYDALTEDQTRKYVGGIGLAAKFLWEETSSKTDPLAPESPLIFMTGPLTGTIVPSSSRYVVAGLSPLTGILGRASAGGKWGYELKRAGFDGIIITGQADGPVYLWVHDAGVEIRPAQHVWGKDTYETTDVLVRETDERASVACIGPAGERLVRIASIMTDGRRGRAAARCGLGALMGSKKLKAVVVRGRQAVGVFNESGLKERVSDLYKSVPPRKKEEVLYEGMAVAKSIFPVGGFPVRNWREGEFPDGVQLAEDARSAEPVFCIGCPYGCGESLYLANGERHMVYEAWGPLGTNCLVADTGALQEAYSLCNRYGLDSISCGGVIGFAMECFEKGLISNRDAGGTALTWGDGASIVKLVRKIALRDGIGELLGQGVKRAAEQIGGRAFEYAMHVKGLEFPAHDPRAAMSCAVAYATGSIGATHMEDPGAKFLEGYTGGADAITTLPELGYHHPMDRFATEGKGILVSRTQDYATMLNSLVVCLFLSWRCGPLRLALLLKEVTGWDVDVEEFMRLGERVFNLMRMLNVRRGISRKDDVLPPRMLTHPRPAGGAAGVVPFLGAMLHEYYSYRGWTEEGIPTREKLSALGLHECLNAAL